MKFIGQHDERDCGAACLAMIAANHGSRLPVSKFLELTKTDGTGTNIYGLVDGAQRIGLEAKALSGSPNELISGIEEREIVFPFIAHTISDDALLHFVVVTGIKRGKVYVADPARGKVRMTLEDFFRQWTGHIVTFHKSENYRPVKRAGRNRLMLYRIIRGQSFRLIGILLLSLLIAAIGILGAFVFEVVMDGFAADRGYYAGIAEQDTSDETPVAEGEEHQHENESFINQVLEAIYHRTSISGFDLVFITLILLYLLQAGIHFARGWLIVTMSKAIDLRLSLPFYEHIIDLPMRSISMRQTGEYLSRISDTSKIRLAISEVTVTLLVDSVMVIACSVILYNQNARLYFVALIMIVLYAAIMIVYRKPIEQSNRRVMEENASLQAYFKESIDGIGTVKAACAEEQVKGKTSFKFRRFVASMFKNSLIAMSQDTIANTVELIGTIVILWLGFAMTLAGKVPIGALMTFYVLLTYFTDPIKNLIGSQPAIQTALVAVDRLNDIMVLQTEDVSGEQTLPEVSCWEMKDVCFRYGNRPLLLKKINISVRRGEKIAIVGESGSGKTTLAKLFLRFYEPESGQVLLNGQDVKGVNLAALRRGISYVSQDTFLFSDTVKNNLRLGCSEASDDEIYHACKVCRADGFIEPLPFGYDTPIDENGADLSGGQRQRLAIARALLKRPQLLIFDEATSNLDTITEAGIKDTIFAFDSEFACVIIAHRLSTIKSCDRIYVLEHGEIVEKGTHDELMSLNGRYASMWKNQ